MNGICADDVGVEEEDEVGCPEAVSQVDVFAADLTASNAWFPLSDYAKANPGEVVLCLVGWRRAASERRIVSYAVRAALLGHIAQRAVSQLGSHALLERIGKWPSSPHSCKRVPSTLGHAVRDVLELIECFNVEDEDSLQALMRACRKNLPNASDRPGAIASDALEEYLRGAEANAREVMAQVS